MASCGPLYRRIEEDLPAVYRRDAESWKQIQDYFLPLNAICREFVLALQELPAWLSPAAPGVVPPGRWDEPLDSHLSRQSDVLDELAAWFDFRFEPGFVWRLPDDDAAEARKIVKDKAQLLRNLPRLMRSRSSPTGFLELLCATFRLDHDKCPKLIEHWAYRAPGATPPPAPEPPEEGCPEEGSREGARRGIVCADEDGPALEDDGVVWRASLLVRCGPPPARIASWTHLRTLREWVDVNAPAHVAMDIHPVSDHFWRELPEKLDSHDDLRELLAEVRAHVLDGEALGVAEDPEGSTDLELDFGRLPGEPDEPDDPDEPEERGESR